MKCEKCNEKEATFYYSSSINGETTQRHLCADCARAEGFGGALDWEPTDLFDGMFRDFFTPGLGLLSPFDSFGLPMGRMMTRMLPAVRIGTARPQTQQEPQPQTQAEASVPADAGAEVRTRREIAALRHQLHAAVKAEDFEKAIQLRDKLRALEQ